MSAGSACDLSFVIVSYNARDYLLRCLESLRAHPSPGMTTEVVIVDNASRDGSAEAAESFRSSAEGPEARVIRRDRNGGFAVAANEGIAAATGEVIVLLNPDAETLGEVAGPLRAYFAAHPDVGIVGPRLVDEDGAVQLSARSFPGYATSLFNRHSLLTRLFPRNPFSRRYLLSDWEHDEERDVDWVSGACMALSRRGIETFGAFDPAYFMYIEDVDLCRRAHAAGMRVVYLPGIVVRHAIGGSTRTAPLRMVVARHASMWRYYRKHRRRNALVDGVTFAAIWARCGVQLALAFVRRVLGRPHRP